MIVMLSKAQIIHATPFDKLRAGFALVSLE